MFHHRYWEKIHTRWDRRVTDGCDSLIAAVKIQIGPESFVAGWEIV